MVCNVTQQVLYLRHNETEIITPDRLNSLLSLPVCRCEVEEPDTLEQASPATDVVVERNEEFNDQNYATDNASEVSLSEGQV